MSAILEVAVLLFASVSLVVLGHWVFRRGWHIGYRAVAVLFVVSLWWAMVNGPLKGHYGQDHGVLSGLLATFGVVLAVSWALRRYNQNWRSWAISGAALVFLALIWWPRLEANRQLAAQAVAGRQTGGSHRSTGPRTPMGVGTHTLECASLSPAGRAAAGCQ